jgi:hypothetical protein
MRRPKLLIVSALLFLLWPATPAARAATTPNDPVFRQQWALRNIQAPQAWDITTGGPVTIAILDTGVSASHPDLRGKVLPGHDFVNNDDDASDDEGHGTYVAGVAAANSNNNVGIAGVCWGCNILPVKVLGPDGHGDDTVIAAGIHWAVDQGARILSMSFGGTDDTPPLREAVAYAHAHNALLIAGDTVTGFATTGDFVDLTAPGVGVWSTGLENGRSSYVAGNGTSAACPHVAGVAGLVLSLRPDLSADQLASLLEASADDRGAPGKDPVNGYGRVNALRAVQMAADPHLALGQAAPNTAPTPGAFAPVAPPADGTRFFGETSHTLRGAFRAFWERNGGLPIFGFPVSEEFVERGEDGHDYTVQYFERYRLEFHPENAPPYDVLLGRMGADELAQQGRTWQTEFPRNEPQPGCHFFAETGQNVCGLIRAAWRAGGLELDGRPGKSEAESLALFGLPISGLVTETLADGQQHQVQWFERARFELHPENAAPYDVQLGLLSSDLTHQRGWR